MAERFVSAGTSEDPPDRDDEWLAAQRELDANALRKKAAAAAGSGMQEGGKSLYEVLQANKAAKQDAFEEAAKLKNQFRSLDEDEIDFLDSVMESTRKRDQEVKKETLEQLEIFRRQREEAEKAALEADRGAEAEIEEEAAWKAGPRKRKKGKEREVVKGLKLRKLSSTAEDSELKKESAPSKESVQTDEKAASPFEAEIPTPAVVNNNAASNTGLAQPKPAATGLGLVDYSSGDDDDND